MKGLTCPECGGRAWMPDNPKLGSAIRCENGHTTIVTIKLIDDLQDALKNAAGLVRTRR